MKFAIFLNILILHIDFCTAQCGKPAITPKQSSLKIVGGDEAIPNSWPWQVYVRLDTVRCGASLINNQWLLTAAHCFSSDISPALISAYIGFHDYTQTTTSSVIKKGVKYIRHPGYVDSSVLNDISLIKLDTPVTFNDKISPICLPNGYVAAISDKVTVTGWGRTSEGGQTSNVLRQVDIKVNQNDVCTQEFGITPLVNSQLCAGDFNPGRDSCQGDSGGPLVKYDSSSNKYLQVGIVSYGVGCKGHGVYTKVSSYEDWIAQQISNSNNEDLSNIGNDFFKVKPNIIFIFYGIFVACFFP